MPVPVATSRSPPSPVDPLSRYALVLVGSALIAPGGVPTNFSRPWERVPMALMVVGHVYVHSWFYVSRLWKIIFLFILVLFCGVLES